MEDNITYITLEKTFLGVLNKQTPIKTKTLWKTKIIISFLK